RHEDRGQSRCEPGSQRRAGFRALCLPARVPCGLISVSLDKNKNAHTKTRYRAPEIRVATLLAHRQATASEPYLLSLDSASAPDGWCPVDGDDSAGTRGDRHGHGNRERTG